MIPDGMAVSLSVQAVVALTQLPQWPLVFVADESWMEQFWDTLWMLPYWGAGLYMGLGVWMYWHPFVFLDIMAVLLTWAQLHERRMRRKDARRRAEHAKAGQAHGGQSQVGQSLGAISGGAVSADASAGSDWASAD